MRFSSYWIRIIALAALMAAVTAQAHSPARSKRRPATVNRNGIPLLPDGTPDYSKFPNPFVVKGWNFDLNGSAGTQSEMKYSEYGLGINAQFYKWLAWRNSIFSHSAPKRKALYGLDMSEQITFWSPGPLALFAAPGWRFAGPDSAPFGEAGLAVNLGALQIRGGGRLLLNSWIRTGTVNETQMFVSIGTGGGR